MPTLAVLATQPERSVDVGVPDAGAFVNAAFAHGVAGHVQTALGAGGLQLPAFAQRMLLTGLARDMVRGALLREELATLGPVIEEACGQKALLIKGPAVADRFYPDPELRPCRG